MRGVETKWLRLGNVARGMETFFRGLEVILQIWRLGGHFCRVHGASAPPPSFNRNFQFNPDLYDPLNPKSRQIRILYDPCSSEQMRVIQIKGTVKEKWKGLSAESYSLQLLIATHENYIWCSYLEKLIYNFVKFMYIQFCIKVVGLKRSNSATNLKTMISQRKLIVN